MSWLTPYHVIRRTYYVIRARSTSVPSTSMRVNIISIFPEFFDGLLGVSIVGRARATGALEVNLVDLRTYGLGRHRQLDDAPFGGGAGMVMMVEPLAAALEPLAGTHRIAMSPAGSGSTRRWARWPWTASTTWSPPRCTPCGSWGRSGRTARPLRPCSARPRSCSERLPTACPFPGRWAGVRYVACPYCGSCLARTPA